MIQTCTYLYSSNFTPQVKEARDQSQIFSRKSISRNTTSSSVYLHLQAMLTGSHGFTHRPNRPWPRAKRFWCPAQTLPKTVAGKFSIGGLCVSAFWITLRFCVLNYNLLTYTLPFCAPAQVGTIFQWGVVPEWRHQLFPKNQPPIPCHIFSQISLSPFKSNVTFSRIARSFRKGGQSVSVESHLSIFCDQYVPY